jgi:hypothetical protein
MRQWDNETEVEKFPTKKFPTKKRVVQSKPWNGEIFNKIDKTETDENKNYFFTLNAPTI